MRVCLSGPFIVMFNRYETNFRVWCSGAKNFVQFSNVDNSYCRRKQNASSVLLPNSWWNINCEQLCVKRNKRRRISRAFFKIIYFRLFSRQRLASFNYGSSTLSKFKRSLRSVPFFFFFFLNVIFLAIHRNREREKIGRRSIRNKMIANNVDSLNLYSYYSAAYKT